MKRTIRFVIPFGIGSIGLIILLYSGLGFNNNLSNSFKQGKCRDKLKIAAGLSGGDSYDFANEIQKLVEKYSAGEICITVSKTEGTQENLKKLENKEAQLATAQADILIMKDLPSLKAVNGKRVDLASSVGLNSAQAVSLLFLDAYQLVVRNDSGIENVSDLKDKRVAMPPKTGGQIHSFAFLMKHYGLIAKDQQLVKLVEVGDEEKAFCNKQVDAVFHVRTVGNESIRNLLTQCNGRLVPIDQAAALKNKNPYLEETEVPKAVYQGGPNPIPNEKVNTVGVPRLLLARSDVRKEVIQQMIQILDNHQQELIAAIPSAAKINLPKGIGLPIHEGAQAYYDREQPSWIEKNAGAIQIILGIVGILITVSPGIWFWLKQREQRRKDKADDYIREVTALMDAEDCIKALVEYLKAKESNDSEQKAKFQNILVEKAAKILLKKREAELDYRKRLISDQSLNSFRRTLERVVSAIKKMLESEEIFSKILNEAMEILVKQGKKRLLHLMSLDKSEITLKEKFKADLDKNLSEAKSLTNIPQALQSSQFVQFLKSASQEIQRDLDAILRRATTALVEERISQKSFQSFRVVWQIAAGGVERESHQSL